MKKAKPKFFVVVHAQSAESSDFSLEHAVESAKIASTAGADGVFFIPDYENEKTGKNKRATVEDLFIFYREAKKQLPIFPIGVNFLKRFNTMDYSLIREIVAERFDMIQSDSSFSKMPALIEIGRTEIFPGLAFKYSIDEDATGHYLQKLCRAVPERENVIPTTSGAATGQAANIEKIAEIRRYLPAGQRLGIASGITLDNAQSFINAGVTDFLVATSLIKENKNGFDILDPDAISKMAKIFQSC